MENFLEKYIEDAFRNDPIKDALVKALYFYADHPSDQSQAVAREFRSAIRLHESDNLPKKRAVRLLRDHADRLEELEWDIQALEFRKIIDEL